MPEGLPPNRVNFNSSCQQEADGKRLLAALRDRLMQFGLSVHEGKTRLIEFGRFAAKRRAAAGQRRPETFNFSGLYALLQQDQKRQVRGQAQDTGQTTGSQAEGDP